ncbi:hypothetical protein GGD63_001210 [Bradyrhizobium sp. cir1]|uniref:hypothetical protein n=1 Tax=Bradyrhizobium sp. cir1 TaxID=1445730 RepID=UPI0016069E3F|nr:hypothetical protein [Bradyrhizobium sp. cir1]MBB4368431.1 hypothetical protein [Bradyrhizobium sp. cir1]
MTAKKIVASTVSPRHIDESKPHSQNCRQQGCRENGNQDFRTSWFGHIVKQASILRKETALLRINRRGEPFIYD